MAPIIAHRLGFVLLALALAALPDGARAQSPEPVLRIEAGTHTAQLNDAATDSDGRVLVTASDDKTARIWSLPDLRLLGVLRPPIGPGNEGKLYAVAVSPDGRFAAVGGWLGPGVGQECIYVFDLTSRSIIRRIGDLPNAVNSLAFAADGRLAAGMGANTGIRVWRDGLSQFQDTNYADDVYGLAFAPNGRLATGTYGGKVRLYDPSGQLLGTEPTQAGNRPYRLRFSPDGAFLAIGFDDAMAVEVRDGGTLALRYRPDVAGLNGEWLSRVAWGADGHTLIAGGAMLDGASQAFSWSDAGQGPRAIVADGYTEAVGALIPLPGGRLILASGSGDIAINAPPDLNRLAEQRPAGGDLRAAGDAADDTRRFRIARGGGAVEWATYPASQRFLRFDPASLDFQAGGAGAPNLTGWVAKARGLTVKDWNYRTNPKLNGRALSLDQHERAQSVAVARNRALLGADWSLRLFAADGAERWEKTVPGVAWRVNQSPDGRIAVAAFGDSTIRWFRAEDGAELLALYVTEDAKRWIAFTPKGYYAASPGAEDLIGWHVNRAPDEAADFFPASRFRDRFYRPDVVSRVIATLDEDKALRQADAARGTAAAAPARPIADDLPPVVTILSPRDGTSVDGSEIELGYALRSPSGKPVSALAVLIDGQRPSFGAIPAVPTLKGRDQEAHGTVRVPIPPGKTVTVSLAATTDRDGEPARIQVTSKAAPVADPGLPRLNGVLVGVSHYPRTAMALKFAEKDAGDVAAAFAEQKRLGRYREVNLPVRPDTTWTRAGILSALRELRQKNQDDDVALVFLSGHGAQSGRRTFFLPIDANPDDLDSTAISKADLLDILADIKGRVLVLLDICHAGAFQVAGRARTVPDMTQLSGELRDTKAGLVIFASSTGTQESEELPNLQNGAFTAAVLQGLRGEALVRPDRLIQTDDLDDYVRLRVRQLTQGRQSATMVRAKDLPDFPILVLAHQ